MPHRAHAYDPPLDEIVRRVGPGHRERPCIVGVSGYGGSGKTTLATALAQRLDAPVVSIDDFGTAAVWQRSADWNGIDRARLVRQVLAPVASGRSEITYDRCDDWERWTTRPVVIQVGRFVVVEGIGLFHPDVLAHIDLRIWVDVDLATATARGVARDQRSGQDTSAAWCEVWVPNEIAFAERFDPRGQADLLVNSRMTTDVSGRH